MKKPYLPRDQKLKHGEKRRPVSKKQEPEKGSPMQANAVRLDDALEIGARGISLTDVNRKVVDALKNPKWDYRTIDGIARETGVTTTLVEQSLATLKDQVVCGLQLDRKGRKLFTHKDRTQRLAAWANRVRAFITKDPILS